MDLKETVISALNTALENGYDQIEDDPELVAFDLCDCDADVIELTMSGANFQEVVAIVKEWQRDKRAEAGF